MKGLLILVLIFSGCTKKSGWQETTVYSGKTATRLTHWVRDYSNWYNVYREVSDSNAWIGVYVSPDDPNLVTVYELTSSHEDARKFFNSEEMRRIMRKSGVTSEPVITYFDITYRTIPKSNKMYRVEIAHDVADYHSWKKVFDANEQKRNDIGLELRGIFTDADNHDHIGVVFATDDIDKLKDMIATEEFQKSKQEAGVASKEMVTFLKVPPKN